VVNRRENTIAKNPSLMDIILLFFKLGIICFGGPAAHIAMMQQEIVKKKNWLSEQQFLDLLGITNLIPGPNSTEMAAHIGYEKLGLKGLLAAGISFILPSILITGFIAVLYKKYGQLPEVYPYVYGIKPAIIAVITAAVYPLARQTVKSAVLAIIGITVLIASLLNFNEAVILFGSGAAAIIINFIKTNKGSFKNLILLPFIQANTFTEESLSNLKLLWIFIKIGSILYGSGYVLFAFLDTELVAKGLLTRQQLIDAVAVGQFTPGPVFSSVTFIGYQIHGYVGAIYLNIHLANSHEVYLFLV
jgi:chromate transporter